MLSRFEWAYLVLAGVSYTFEGQLESCKSECSREDGQPLSHIPQLTSPQVTGTMGKYAVRNGDSRPLRLTFRTGTESLPLPPINQHK